MGSWYASRSPESLAYQAVKYRQREGVTHRDLLRLAHPAGRVSAGNPTLEVSDEHRRLFEWIVRGGVTDGLPRIVEGFALAQSATTPARGGRARPRVRPAARGARQRAPDRSRGLGGAARGHADDRAGSQPGDDDAGRASSTPGSEGTAKAVAQLGDRERIRKARVHPIALLAALRTYASGHGLRGRHVWTPVPAIVDALDAAFYTAFENVEPAGKRLLLALDVSGSMTGGSVAGVPGLTPRDASAALALVTAATETRYETVGFFAGKGGWKSGRSTWAGRVDGLTPLTISPRQRLDDVLRTVDGLPFGGTDCALPMLYAQARKREIDTFVIYTDSETWAGDVHPARALADYRHASGIDARLVVVGMVSNGFSIADPNDPGMLDVVGFDTATPQLISDFARGAL